MASIGIIGSEGRMGQAIAAFLAEGSHSLAGGADQGGDAATLADRSEVLVDFSSPAALEANLHAAIGAGIRSWSAPPGSASGTTPRSTAPRTPSLCSRPATPRSA